jgi:hypothetical protein
MITSNINEILLKNENINIKNSTRSNAFLKSIINSNTTNNLSEDRNRDNSLTYSNIKGISLEEIDTLFVNEDSKNIATNLRLATLFSQDDTLGQALFNTVLGEPFELGYSYLFDRYEDKSSFLSSSSSSSLTDLLHSTITNKLDSSDKKVTEVISQDRLDEILLKVNSFDFVTSLSSTSKDQYGRYKDDDEDNDYSFLYNDYAMKYQELSYKYQEIDTYNKNIIKQF